MSCDAKKMYLQMEGDAYFERNLEAQKVNGATKVLNYFMILLCVRLMEGM